MKRILITALLLMVIGCGQKEESMEKLSDRVFALAVDKFKEMDSLALVDVCVVSADSAGNIKYGDMTWWTSGFFPGSLWLVYEYTKDENIRSIAQERF